MNETIPAGYLYLISKYSLDVCELFSCSYMTFRSVKETVRHGVPLCRGKPNCLYRNFPKNVIIKVGFRGEEREKDNDLYGEVQRENRRDKIAGS